jgi:lysophospholipase L1-like esterase
MSSRLAALAWMITPTLVTVLAASPAQAAAAVDYVALGDSYAAGLGTPGATGWCGRSPAGYPQLWAARNAVASFRSVACSGATSADLRRDQLSALSRDTDLVSVTIGGNDSGFAPTVVSCVLATDSGCVAAVSVARAYITHLLAGQLDATYAAIRQRAPQARVVALAYPRLFDPNGGP